MAQPAGCAALGPAGDDLAEPAEVELIVGIADEVERGDGRAAHRVDVAEGVGGRDLAVDEGVVRRPEGKSRSSARWRVPA